ncbi:MAG TPA: hypothetical protein VLD65_13575, partial [Anaerolineales bacterium]|nr:hypothetical protein [Anaerolineales bacterium]
MSITLTTTWYPRGELERFARYLPKLEELYAHLVICLIPEGDASIHEQFTSGKYASDPQIIFRLNEQRCNGRYLALKAALEAPGDYIHYVDMDRLLHWVETRPEEWQQIVELIPEADCSIFGRTEAATRTHPQALITTEMLSNRVVSHFLDTEMDVSAGSKAFCRAAAQYLVAHGSSDNSIGTDAEWPILLKKAGFHLQYILVDGLDYESADQFMLRAATGAEQREAAALYDKDATHWSARVAIADQIIKSALEVSQMIYPTVTSGKSSTEEFDFAAVFDVDDYLYFYGEMLTDERTDTEVRALVGMLELDNPKRILDLACGFGRHSNRLAALGHTITG